MSVTNKKSNEKWGFVDWSKAMCCRAGVRGRRVVRDPLHTFDSLLICVERSPSGTVDSIADTIMGRVQLFFFKKKWTLSLKKWTFEKKTKTHGRQILNVDLLVPGWDASRTNLQLILLGHPFEGGREDAIYCNMLPHCYYPKYNFQMKFFGVGKSIKKYLPALSFITEILQQCLQAMGQTQPALLWEE